MGVYESPCIGCEDRTINCHDTCKRYLDWKADISDRFNARLKIKDDYAPLLPPRKHGKR